MTDTPEPPTATARSDRDDLERRLTTMETIATARVTSDAAPLQIQGELTDGRPYYFRARRGTATLSIAQPGGDPIALHAPTEHIPCDFVEVAGMTGRVALLVRTLLVKHGLLGSSELLPSGDIEPIGYSFMRGDYSCPRTFRVHTDGGTVDLTLGFTNGQRQPIIDVRVTPHNGPIAEGADAGCTWQLEHIDGGLRLLRQPPTAATDPA